MFPQLQALAVADLLTFGAIRAVAPPIRIITKVKFFTSVGTKIKNVSVNKSKLRSLPPIMARG